MNAALEALLDFSYSLYVVEHNCGPINERDRKRLLQPTQFLEASYELWITAWMIRTGFKLTFEDESDNTTTHCEFVAKYPKTGRSFSVEAKRRQPNEQPKNVGRNLKDALKKRADHTRIIMIEANLPEKNDSENLRQTMDQVLEGLRFREDNPPFPDREADPAYVFVTNSPFEHHPTEELGRWAIAEGFKIPSLKLGAKFASVRELVDSRDQNLEAFLLMDSLSTHSQIPVTFDGNIPELIYGKTRPRLLIGERYLVPNDRGEMVPAELISATVNESQKNAFCSVQSESGENFLITASLTEDELEAYWWYPATFFGRNNGGNRKCRDPLDLYDSLLKTYSKTPKTKLLEFMKTMPDCELLKELSQNELAKLCAERFAQSQVNEGTFNDLLEQ